jgi:5-methyltetrahydrofolate--homocysteine methyltransferase
MVHVAGEMERQGFEVPLLIGGATTSKLHSAVKIAPRYSAPVVHVLDASRAVGVCSQLLSEETSERYAEQVRDEYQQLREKREGGAQRELRPLAEARESRYSIDWSSYEPPQPSFLGLRTFENYPLTELCERIDWTPFFAAWDMKGRFPDILKDDEKGEVARSLYDDARRMLDEIVRGELLQARAVVGFWPAASDGDDVLLFESDDRREEVRARVCFLRQQVPKRGDRPDLCLADFVAPRSSGLRDYLGGFAVTAGGGLDELVAARESEQDDYNAILLKAIADRLAEAFAERLHEQVRRELWGYAPDEDLDNEALIRERYRGIRPAPGYPACPDHTEKGLLFDLLEAPSRAGITLTESYAMMPAASVSGYYLSHPKSHYFGIGRIGRDQVEDYAKRKGLSVEEVEKWLAPSLGYEPTEKKPA